jgi:hypothetical protein
LGLVTIFYCLRFETSLFVASYDSQGHGGGIRPRLHRVFSYNPSARTTQKTAIIKQACLLVRYLAVVVLLLRMLHGNVYRVIA